MMNGLLNKRGNESLGRLSKSRGHLKVQRRGRRDALELPPRSLSDTLLTNPPGADSEHFINQ